MHLNPCMSALSFCRSLDVTIWWRSGEMKPFLDFLLLAAVKIVSDLLFRFRGERVDVVPQDGWSRVRLLAFLNHTSLYEPVLAGFAPYPLLWRFAFHGVLPVAEKTMRRNIGLFFRFLARNVVVVTRQRDETWDEVLNRIDRNAIVMILPEGRMMRRNGLDASGREMTVRGGIADILDVLDDGLMLVVYSGGLHHIQAPGELLPRPFKTVRARVELVEIADYRRDLGHDRGLEVFRAAVIDDLTARRDRLCPVLENGSVRGGEVPRWRGWPYY